MKANGNLLLKDIPKLENFDYKQVTVCITPTNVVHRRSALLTSNTPEFSLQLSFTAPVGFMSMLVVGTVSGHVVPGRDQR